MLTAVNRNMDRWSSPYLASSAYVGARGFPASLPRRTRTRSPARSTRAASQGSRAAILGDADGRGALLPAPRRRPAARFERAPSLGGDAEEFKFDKVGGQHLDVRVGVPAALGGLRDQRPRLSAPRRPAVVEHVGRLLRPARARASTTASSGTTTGGSTGRPTACRSRPRTTPTSTSRSRTTGAGTWAARSASSARRTTIGGARRAGDSAGPYFAPWIVHQRRRSPGARAVSVASNYFRGGGGRNSSWSVEPGDRLQDARADSARRSRSTGRTTSPTTSGTATSPIAGATHYTFAHLDQTTTSATVRLNYTFTPSVSLQAYTQPFVSKGTYTNVRQLSATPRAVGVRRSLRGVRRHRRSRTIPADSTSRSSSRTSCSAGSTSPGSTLFVVWNEGRQGFDAVRRERTTFSGDVRDLLRLHPANTFLVKMSYWLNR